MLTPCMDTLAGILDCQRDAQELHAKALHLDLCPPSIGEHTKRKEAVLEAMAAFRASVKHLEQAFQREVI